MKSTTKKLDRKEALEILENADHGFFSPEGARAIGEAFGITVRLETQTVNSRAFKGLSVPGKKDGEKVSGLSAHILAEQICNHLRLGTAAGIGIEGRGSQLRFNCELIRRELRKEEAGA